MAISRPDEVYNFPNNLPIEVSYKNTKTYSKCGSYDPGVIAQGYVWHQIVVQHNGKFSGRDSMPEILEIIFRTVEGEELFPIAYRRGVKDDRFLVRKCKSAINKLFEHKLRVQLSDGSFIQLQVHFNVGDFKLGQISPYAKLTEALNRLYACMERINGVDGVLNLCRFNTQAEFFDLVVNLGNRAVFEVICNLIYRNDEKFRLVNGLILSDNGITTVAPLTVFAGVEFGVLDLSKNKIISSSRLCRDLSEMKADVLLLAGNPITNSNNYPECLRPIQNNFKLIDGMPAENLSKYYSPFDYEVDINRNGYRVDLNNKKDVLMFQHSNDWHAIVIPDSGQEFTKHEIMDYFFVTVSQKLSDIYPCYYKFATDEHQFLVRQCFDQLKYLIDICKMEINVPRLTTFDKHSALSEIQIHKILKYYMVMNIRPYKRGQIEPMECIGKALTRRYNGINRQLNLDNFESVEGLENIVINLSSPKILSRVLMQASRKFLSSCVELRLAHNKITTANVSKALNIMSNLKAIDLGNNWILDLEGVKELSSLGLKTLRLDGNPLCTKYSFAGEYIKAVRRHFPELTKLDNIDIKNKDYLSSQKNFLCDVRGYDFVNEFVPQFLKCFDHDRQSLKELYHQNAIFTISFNYIIAQMTSENFRRISKYRENCRNILKISDLSRANTSMHLGATQIMQVFFQLPSTRHDLLTFNTDTMIYNENVIVITINGVFYDQALSVVDNDILMSFTRTFVLIPVETKLGLLNRAIKYQIVNDQLSIYNPTTQQFKRAFKYFKSECLVDNDEVTVSDKEALIILFQEVTNLKSVWCTRFLEDTKWNFKKSLLIFLSFCDKKQIPDTAFN